MKRMIAAAALFLAVPCSWAQYSTPAPWAAGGTGRPEDLKITLVTIDPSEPIYTWWGHTGLIVEDTRLHASRMYNYGLFSFEREHFVADTILGRLWYGIAAFPVAGYLASERRLDRAIRFQVLNLPMGSRTALAQALERDILPGNNLYLYDHFRDNCTTRVRDRIDQAIGGRLAAVSLDPARMSLRDHAHRFSSRSFLVDWILMSALSAGVVDAPATQWQEMFLPSELERDVRLVRVPDGHGGETSLVAQESVYSESRRSPAPPAWPGAFIIGGVLAAVALLLGVFSRGGKPAARICLGIHIALVGMVFGTLGWLFFFMSYFTNHTVTRGNENLFLTNPLMLVMIPLGIMAARRRGKGDGRMRRLAYAWLALAAIAAAYLLVKVLFGLPQANLQTAAVLAPALAGLAGGSLMSVSAKKGDPNGR